MNGRLNGSIDGGSEAGREQLALIGEREDRAGERPRVHQAPQADDRRVHADIADVVESEAVVPALVGDDPVDRAVKPILADRLGKDRGLRDQPVRGIGEDHRVVAGHADRERRDVTPGLSFARSL